eukprot:gnl/MRDRNA2_/MRDRNA2_90002_c0_seq1.p1 gnl/MRDRNA2_/MRDRNA2_90002_c0~~gnl/MRDRNA2_/MRDRNA2_90002_c0_seq1.p1  ORF type:complete len:125 (+),score=39.73 gnl/MRDRNA2_/MRDRNA2_90002_c0_seq1:99-473(+)
MMRQLLFLGLILHISYAEKSKEDIDDILAKMKGVPGMENIKVFGKDDIENMMKEGGGMFGQKSAPAHDYKQDLIDFYTKYGLEDKIDGVDAALEKWKGKEYKMMLALRKKYKKVIEEKEKSGEL